MRIWSVGWGKVRFKYQIPGHTEYVRIRDCNRSIELHFTDTLQVSIANCGLKTEAELILARVGKVETHLLFTLVFNKLYYGVVHARTGVARQVKINRFTYCLIT